jgi:hypothetical protein
VSRERTTTWSRLRASDAADAGARVASPRDCTVVGARASPRSCRVHSRERDRGSHAVALLGDRARPPHTDCVHGIERRVTEPFAQAATASRSRARASNCGERRAKGPAGPRGEARCAKLVVRACDVANAVASVASAIGATEQAPLPVSRERTTTWSRLRAWDAADAGARVGSARDCMVVGARTSPRSCRVHSRERDRGPHAVALLGDRARPPHTDCVHGIERRVTEPFAQAATASRSRRAWLTRRVLAPRIGASVARRARQDRGERRDARSWWFAHATWRTPWRVSRLPSARRSRRRCPCRVSARPRGRVLALAL